MNMIKLQYIVNRRVIYNSFFIYFSMKLKRYKKKTIGSYISREIIIIILSIFMAIIIINYFYKKFNSVVVPLAEIETRKYITEVINKSTENIKFDKNLFIIDKDNNNEIKMINYNSYEVTALVNKITNNIQDEFNVILKDNNTVIEIPLGIVFNNSLLRNFGPMIKIRLEIIGNVLSELQTEVKPYGINNALVEVRVKLEANARIVLPIVSKDINVTNIVPISINIVNGKIPEAYIYSYK